MNRPSIQSIILAAGKSTRMNSGRSKLLEKICGREMILYQTLLMKELKIPTTLVLGHQSDQIKQTIMHHHQNDTINFAEQLEQRGTGHALFASKQFWSSDLLLVLNADMPLITQTIIDQLIDTHISQKASLSFVVSHTDDPTNSYGRVLWQNNKLRIVEAREFTGDSADACCINAGIYLIDRKWLESGLQLPLHGDKQEYYITDLIGIAADQDLVVETIKAPFDRIRGVNTFKEMWAIEQIKRSDLIAHWMDKGVRFYAAQSVHVDIDISINPGTYIGCGVHVLNGTHIGNNCVIEAFSILDNAEIADNVIVHSHCVIKNSTINKTCQIGPFAHIRNQSIIDEQSTIGNFVEVKQSTIGTQTKAKHLAYLGDAAIGSEVNIGAGTITCNYNGTEKQKTVIEDNAFIGSNNTLVAPVTIGKSAYTAAGSVITQSVPENALALGRARQVNKENYATPLREPKEIDNSSDAPFLAATKTDSETSFI
jgi:bifunctional UDP-N-acetylglucosamine pyrophosphorylase/glucosamine-1-phosphate N-acetyltransferase